MNDAIGNPIVIGNTYGYSTNSNGFTRVTIGVATKINGNKVSIKPTLVKERLYDGKPETLNKSKTLSAQGMILFPIHSTDNVEYRLGDPVTTEYYDHGETFKVVGIRDKELELRGDWSGGIHNVDQISWYPKENCKIKK